jgi:hypothetical protein
LPCPPFLLFGVLPRGLSVRFLSASVTFAFHHTALPIAILHSSVATGAVVGTSGIGASGLAEVFRVGCVAAVGFVVGGHGEDLFASMSSSSWVAVVAWHECIRL